MIAPLRLLARRIRRRKPVVSTLTHHEATRLLVDYHFGRLSPEQSSAVEAHVRTCTICRQEGLDHAPTEHHAALRRLVSVRGARPAPRVRPRALVIALLIATAALLILGTLRIGPGLLDSGRASMPPPQLVARTLLPLNTVSATGVASDPGGSLLAVTTSSPTTILLSQANSGLLAQQLSWPGSGTPATLAWSPNGHYLAATDGAMVAIWSVPGPPSASRLHAVRLWVHAVPQSPSAAVYAVNNGQVVDTPDLATQLAQHAFLAWESDGTLSPAPDGAAAPIDAAAEGGPLVGMWRMGGTQLVPQPGGQVGVGSRATDTPNAGDLDWSPDDNFVLWSRVVQPVALSSSTANSAAPGAPPPDEPLAVVADHLAARGSGDALAWFTPDGRAIALCDPSSAGAALQIVDLDSDLPIYTLPGACAGLSVTRATWLADGTTLVLALHDQTVQEYPISLPSS